MLVNEVMTTPVVTVRDDDTVRRAAEVLLEHRIASAPVLDAEDRLVGIVSEADLLRGRTGRDPRAHLRPVGPDPEPPATTVAAVMTTRPLSVRSGADVDDASRLLLEHGIKAAPVVEGHRVVGVVARRDLLKSFARPDADVRRDVLDLLAAFGQDTGWEVQVSDGVVTLTSTEPERPDARQVAPVLARTVPGVVRVRTPAEGGPAEG